MKPLSKHIQESLEEALTDIDKFTSLDAKSIVDLAVSKEESTEEKQDVV